MAESDDNSLPPDGSIRRWCELICDGAAKADEHPFKVRFTGAELRQHMEDAGFIDVTVKNYKLPIGPWPVDKRLRYAGSLALGAMIDGIHGISAAVFSRSLKWSPEEMEVFLAQVRNEWRQKTVHSYWPM